MSVDTRQYAAILIFFGFDFFPLEVEFVFACITVTLLAIYNLLLYNCRFIIGGRLNVRLVLEKFVETFNRLYGDKNDTFLEDEGRKYFMLFLKPIINGVGNCYVEAQTRDHERMDLVIDYNGEQSIVEMKIWHGDAYNKRGEEQLVGYLDFFGIKKGYMLSFNFNKKKEIGVYDRVIRDKLLVEAIV